jgi:outer membrane protein OmpA-like peptidoglycan-associated protein
LAYLQIFKLLISIESFIFGFSSKYPINPYSNNTMKKTIGLLVILLTFKVTLALSITPNDSTRFYELDIRIYHADTYMDMDNIKVKLINIATRQVDSTMAISSHVTFKVEKCNSYEILVLKKGFLSRRATFDANCFRKDVSKRYCMTGMNLLNALKMSGDYDARLEAELGLTPVEINKVFKVENIYYDLNKWEIRPDAAKELDKLVTILKDNPTIQVELGSHTDARSSDEYNFDLSQKRAESAVAYIVSQGIAQMRISAKGYGESKLINRCKNGVPCSETEHQQNRRTEVRITGVLD